MRKLRFRACSAAAGGPGRLCPLRYRYGAAAIAAAPEHVAETLYVIGGLYGNLPALDAIEAMAAAEPGPVTLCFNGDFNWFNVDDAGFRAINQRVLRHSFIPGNVEAELGSGSDDAGCGCAYPESVDGAVVERSNQIHAALKRTAQRHPDLLARLEKSALAARWRVGDLRIGVVHGDADSLAGWRFDAANLDDPGAARLAGRRLCPGRGGRFRQQPHLPARHALFRLSRRKVDRQQRRRRHAEFRRHAITAS